MTPSSIIRHEEVSEEGEKSKRRVCTIIKRVSGIVCIYLEQGKGTRVLNDLFPSQSRVFQRSIKKGAMERSILDAAHTLTNCAQASANIYNINSSVYFNTMP